MNTYICGNIFKITIKQYRDEDFDIVTDQRGYFGFDIEVIDGKIEIGN